MSLLSCPCHPSCVQVVPALWWVVDQSATSCGEKDGWPEVTRGQAGEDGELWCG